MPFERAMRWVEFILAWNEQPNSQGRTPYEEGRASLITDVRRIQ
jgi:hypothetical protein